MVTELVVNGRRYKLDVEVGRSLAEVLREDLSLTGTKIACFEGHCGACTVQVDGIPTMSCITLAHTVDGRDDAVQCGFCTPAQIVSAAALVEANEHPSDEEIRHAMAGNLCRCGTYPKIEEAIRTWQD